MKSFCSSQALAAMQAVAQFAPQVTDKKLHRCQHITGVACSADGRHVLANYLNDHIYLFSLDGTGEGSCPEQAPECSTGSRRARADVTADSASMHTAVLRSAVPGLMRSSYIALQVAADPGGLFLPQRACSLQASQTYAPYSRHLKLPSRSSRVPQFLDLQRKDAFLLCVWLMWLGAAVAGHAGSGRASPARRSGPGPRRSARSVPRRQRAEALCERAADLRRDGHISVRSCLLKPALSLPCHVHAHPKSKSAHALLCRCSAMLSLSYSSPGAPLVRGQAHVSHVWRSPALCSPGTHACAGLG